MHLSKFIIIITASISFSLNTVAQGNDVALTDTSTFVAKAHEIIGCDYFISAEDALNHQYTRGNISENTLLPLISMYKMKYKYINETATICKILYQGKLYYVGSIDLNITEPIKSYLLSKSGAGEETRQKQAFKTLELINKYEGLQAEKEEINQNLTLSKAKKAELGINYYLISQHLDNTVNFDISLINYSKKSVKYAFVTVYGYNGVKDLVAKKTITLTGPAKFETALHHGEELIFYSPALCRVDAKFKLSIRIKYMDGSSKLFSGSTIDDITFVKPIDENFQED